MSNNQITINNSITEAGRTVTARIPPNAPLDLGSLLTLFNSMTPSATAPTLPTAGDVYLDDGTNTESEKLGFRRYTGSEWEDFGLQEAASSGITSTPTSGQYEITDIRLDASLNLYIEYDSTPA